jgi:hypothetical protein
MEGLVKLGAEDWVTVELGCRVIHIYLHMK